MILMNNRIQLHYLFCICSLLITSPVYADESAVLEEIIVTAEKRSVNLQKLSVSVSALTAEDLDSNNLISPVDLSGQVPGLLISKNNSYTRVAVIRGLGWEANQNALSTPSVSIHQDGVFRPSVFSAFNDFLDVERIEILRGPQGTVFGQNSTGGAINIITKQPELGEFYGNADVSVGTFDLLRTRAVLNVPINETMSARGGFQYFSHDGFAEIVDTSIAGHELDDASNYLGRLQVLWQPEDNFKVTLRAEYFSMDNNESAQKNILDTEPDPRKLRQDFAGTFEMDNELYSATIEWEHPWATIRSITSYSQDVNRLTTDNDHGAPPEVTPANHIPTQDRWREVWSQEIDFISNGDGLFDWTAGFFYFEMKNRTEFFEFIDDGDGVIDFTLDPTNVFSNPDLGFISQGRQKRKSWSVFGQGTYNVSDNLRLVGGIRYTDDQTRSKSCNFLCTTPVPSQTKVEEVTGKAALEWDVMSDVMGYGSWTRGFKPGGSGLTGGGLLVTRAFKPESIDAYEIGIKSRFSDDRFQINAAGFYYDYSDYQFMSDDPIPFSGGVGNIPEVEIYGAELEFTGILTEELRLTAGLSWMEGEFISDALALDSVDANLATQQSFANGFALFDPQTIAARQGSIVNLKGQTPAKMPEISFNASITHTLEIDGHGTLTSNVQYQYQDDFSYRVYNVGPLDTISSYDLWDLYFMYKPYDNDWSLEFIVNNLEDDDAVSSRFTDIFGIGSTSQEFLTPRQFIVRLGYEF